MVNRSMAVLVVAAFLSSSCSSATDQRQTERTVLVAEMAAPGDVGFGDPKEEGVEPQRRVRCAGGDAPEACVQAPVREGVEQLLRRRGSKLAQCFRPVVQRWRKQRCSEDEARERWEKALAETEDPAVRRAMEQAYEARQQRRPEKLRIDLHLALTISEKARVSKVEILDHTRNELIDKRFKSCIKRQLLHQKVSHAPEGGTVIFHISLPFQGC